MTSLPQLCGTGMTMLTLTEDRERCLRGQHSCAASDMRHGTRVDVSVSDCGFPQKHTSALWRCMFLLTHACGSIPHRRLKVICCCITQTFQRSPGQATNLWVRLSPLWSTVCKSLHSLHKDDLSSSRTCICHVLKNCFVLLVRQKEHSVPIRCI